MNQWLTLDTFCCPKTSCDADHGQRAAGSADHRSHLALPVHYCKPASLGSHAWYKILCVDCVGMVWYVYGGMVWWSIPPSTSTSDGISWQAINRVSRLGRGHSSGPHENLPPSLCGSVSSHCYGGMVLVPYLPQFLLGPEKSGVFHLP